MRALVQAQPFGKQRLPQSSFEVRRLAIQIAAGNRGKEVTEQTGRHLRGDQHRYIAGRHWAGSKAPYGTFGSTPTDCLRSRQFTGDAADIIVVVALHLPFGLGDHHAAQAVPAAAVGADEAIAIAVAATAAVSAQRDRKSVV